MLGLRAQGTVLCQKRPFVAQELESKLSSLREQNLPLFPNPFRAPIFANSPSMGGVQEFGGSTVEKQGTDCSARRRVAKRIPDCMLL